MSYGAEPTRLDFENGLTLIHGQNGSGKSSAFLEALSYSLFGKVYRKDVVLSDLINWTNLKNLEVTIAFDNTKDNYRVTRGIKPTKFIIYKNEEPVDMSSTSGLSQEGLEEILGIGISMFKQIVSLAVCNNKPFLSMKLEDKRDVLENVFNVRRFGKMLSLLKKQVSQDKVTYEIGKSSIKILEDNLISMKNNIAGLKVAKSNWETEKKQKVLSHETNINNNNTSIKSYEEHLIKCAAELEAAKTNKIQAEIDYKKVVSDKEEYQKNLLNKQDPPEIAILKQQQKEAFEKVELIKAEEIKPDQAEVKLLQDSIDLLNTDIESINNHTYTNTNLYLRSEYIQVRERLNAAEILKVDEDQRVVDAKKILDEKETELNNKREEYEKANTILTTLKTNTDIINTL